MLARAFPAVAAALLVACASGGPAAGDPASPAADGILFRHGVPTPATATYQMADTMTMIMTTPDMEMDMAQTTGMTVALSFAEDPGGVRVTGAVSDYSSSMWSSMMGDMGAGDEEVSGELEFVLGPLGDVQVVASAQMTGGGGLISAPFNLNTEGLFPRFPERPLRAGDMWADTVTESVDMSEIEAGMPGTAGSTGITTYTLVGDTVVGGRTYQKITLSGTITSSADAGEPGGSEMSDMSGSVEGFLLWDPDRGLVALAELVTTNEGSMSMMGDAMAMTGAGTSKVRLVN